MTRNIFKNSKSKLILILLLVGIFCLSLFSVACKKDENTESDIPSYSYTDTNDGELSNPSFAYGTLETELSNFPKTSPTGWARSKDSNDKIMQSQAKSGAVKVTDKGWDALMQSLYGDTYIRKYVERVCGIDKDSVTAEIKNSKGDNNYKVTSDDLKKYYAEKYYSEVFKNPSTRPNSDDKIVYMLNNFTSKLDVGSAQKITSASEIVLNKGEYGKFSVWIKTQNLLESENGNYGANIRLINEFNGTTQAEYAIKNIRNNEWTEYTVYVKADEHFETTVKLVLGLGYGLNGVTQGTVYFDDVQFTHLTAEDFNKEVKGKNASIEKFAYNNDSKIVIDGSAMSTGTYFNNNYVLYDMTLTSYLKENVSDLFSAFSGTVNGAYTLSNKGSDGKRFDDSTCLVSNVSTIEKEPFDNATAKKIDINKASYTLNYDGFSVGCEEYVYVAFYVKNQLSKFGSTDITVNVFETYKGYEQLNAAVATISKVSDDWQKVDLVIKNNFVDLDTDREFNIEVVIGPADVSEAKYAHDFASGTVLITTPIIATGTTVKYDGDNESEKLEADKYYDIYSLISKSPSGSVALTAGFSSNDDSSDMEIYSLTTAPSDIGAIIEYPASVKGYQGIVANHFYVKEEVEGQEIARDIDTRKKGDANGVAGLINTKYLDNYVSNVPALSGLKNALDFTATDEEKNIQPIMIYNANKNHYGYIGSTTNIATSTHAKVSVTLRVVDSAKAYVYLVNVDNDSKEVLTFDIDQTSNALMLDVGKDNMTDTGWVTVEFYLATGAADKNIRVEIWNGGRDGLDATASKGYVFIKDVSIETAIDNFEPNDKNSAFTVAGNPLYKEAKENLEPLTSTILYTRQLTALEKQYNSEHKDGKVSYKENYVWVQSTTMVYAIYNTIDPVEKDPYENEKTEEESTSNGCAAETDPSTFWLSFSSIVLGVALVLAILMLVLKNVRRRRKANASDAKSHYTITSRTKVQKPAKKVKEEVVEETEDEITEEVKETETADTEENTEENKEETLDSYVYGDVEVFGENNKEENND